MMAGPDRQDVTLNTLHDDLTAGFADLQGEVQTGFGDLRGEMRAGFADLKDEMRSGFADLKTTLIAGFRSLPSRESSEEMVRLLRGANRLHEERFTQLDVHIREQHLEVQQVLHTVVEGQRLLVEGQRTLVGDLTALIARIDALISRRGDGGGASPPV